MKLRVDAEREVFRGRTIRLVLRDLTLPNGRQTRFNIVEHPGAVAIVPIFENGDLLLIRQFRPSVGQELYEVPAGTLEPGETPLKTAQREIIEETGYRARRWEKLAEFYTAPGFCTEFMHLYVARDLEPATADGDPDEVIRPVRVSAREAKALLDKGRVRDAKSIIGILMTHGSRRRKTGKK